MVVVVEGRSSTLIGSPSTAAECSSAMGAASGAVVEALPGRPLRLPPVKLGRVMAFLMLVLGLEANAGATLATGAALSLEISSSGAAVDEEAEKPLTRPLVLANLLLSLGLNSWTAGAAVLASTETTGFLVLVLGFLPGPLPLRMRPLVRLSVVVGASVVVVVVVVTGIVVGTEVTGKVVISSSFSESSTSSVVLSSAKEGSTTSLALIIKTILDQSNYYHKLSLVRLIHLLGKVVSVLEGSVKSS